MSKRNRTNWLGALRFRIARWFFIRLDRHMDRFLNRLSDEQLDELYRRCK